ncbi:MAG: carboxypeptidase-like regulatory domain-containing protein, partial [Candidatus Latescibacteria bacterium]|nr:carboxypeptidase-like regulatory domain-containing protein [Candidatus Latescibacterota bacterium]
MELKGKTRLVILLLLAGVLTFSGVVFAGTTGKIAGKVVDKETGETLPGVNVIIEGTGLGASTDLEGRYFILNIPIGAYTLKASMIGYVEMEIRNVEVIVDLTTTINFSLKPTIIEVAEAITVTA